MVVTRSGMDTSSDPPPLDTTSIGPSDMAYAEPYPTAPLSPVSPVLSASVDSMVRAMMEMILKQDQQRWAAEREKEDHRLAAEREKEERRLAADHEREDRLLAAEEARLVVDRED